MMKRILALSILFILMLTLSACSEPPTVNAEFTAPFSVQYNGIDYAGTVSNSGSSLTLSMTAPYTVQGMVFDYQDSTLSVRYADCAANANADYLPSDSIPSILHNNLAYLAQASYDSSQDGADSFTLPTPYGEAALTAKEGIPTSLTDPKSGIEFTFG